MTNTQTKGAMVHQVSEDSMPALKISAQELAIIQTGFMKDYTGL